MLLAQAADLNFWNGANGSTDLWIKIVVALVLGIASIFALMAAPARVRRPIVVFVTFISGLFYVLYYFWPRPIDKDAGEIPQAGVEAVSFWFSDALTVVADFTIILSGLLLGLGIYSLLRVHGRRLIKLQKDWGFSAVLILSMVLMVIFGYGDWLSRRGEAGSRLAEQANWGPVNYASDFLFDGLLQQMDAAMFSLIAFFILSAAYRAFRIRSIEATILLATALIMILSLMGAVQYMSNQAIESVAGPNPDAFARNFSLTAVAGWISTNIQTPAIRVIDIGIGIGALAMGLRLWLSLEKSGGNP
jgi:hypothetical protein